MERDLRRRMGPGARDPTERDGIGNAVFRGFEDRFFPDGNGGLVTMCTSISFFGDSGFIMSLGSRGHRWRRGCCGSFGSVPNITVANDVLACKDFRSLRWKSEDEKCVKFQET